ncbi:MAG: efflux RND transporter permease subunit, partial [Pseudomonadota bacterium]
MNITAAAIENNRVTIFIVIALLFGGVSSYIALPKAQDPGFTIRTATVTTVFPGASAERVELLVTDAIEDKVSEMPELDELTSESRTGISIITVTFDQSYFDMQPIFDDLRRKVEGMASELPDGAFASVVNDEYGDTYGHLYTVFGDGFSAKELSDYATDIRDALLLDPDVAKVDIYGDQEESIYIEYDNARLTELGLSPQELQGILQSLNILSSGGDIVIGSERIDLEPSGNFETLSDIENSIVEIPGSGSLIRLRDIAQIKREYLDPPEVI